MNILIIDSSMEPNNAAQKPATINPATSFATSKNIRALITNVKSPKVSRFKGSVKTKIIGRIKTFTSPIINAANKAVEKFKKLIPGTTQAVNSKAAANNNHLIINLTIFLSYFMRTLQYKAKGGKFH